MLQPVTNRRKAKCHAAKSMAELRATTGTFDSDNLNFQSESLSAGKDIVDRPQQWIRYHNRTRMNCNQMN